MAWLAVPLVLLAIALLLAAFFSSAETAFVALRRVRLRHLERTGVRGAGRLRRLAEHSDRTLLTILVGSSLVSTGAAALGTLIVGAYLSGGLAVLVSTVLVTALLLVIGETTPKTVALRHSERLSLLYAPILAFLSKLLVPVTSLLGWLGSTVASIAGGPTPGPELSLEEIATVIAMGRETGVLPQQEAEILRNALTLQNTPVREVMVPRVGVTGVEAEQSLETVATLVVSSGYTRLPVYEGDLDHLVGVVHAKDVLARVVAGETEGRARSIMRPLLLTTETSKAASLLREMREQNTQMAAVIDEYGGTAGVVTLEDLLEELVGEITSEYGAERRLIQSVGDTEAVVDATLSIEDLNDAFGVDLPSEEVDTVGGFVQQQLGRIPEAGDRFRYRNLEVHVLSMKGRRVGMVSITKSQSGNRAA